MNGGGLASGAEPPTTPVYSATNGGWNSTTGVFTPTSGNPSLTVSVGDWAHVFLDGTTTPTSATTLVGRVTAVSSTTVTVSTTIKAGTAPTTAATGLSINVGGAWKGFNGTDYFPCNFMSGAALNASSNPPRVNFKNDQTYSITTPGITNSVSNSGLAPITWQGYTTSAGDLGKAILDGGTSGSAFSLWINSQRNQVMTDWEFRNNGAIGNANAVTTGSGFSDQYVIRCIVHDVRGIGFNLSGAAAIECEAYRCNQGNAASSGGFNGGVLFLRCISHDNSGANSIGFFNPQRMVNCIAANNGNSGVNISTTSVQGLFIGCDFYNNSLHGLFLSAASELAYVENCNFLKNGGWGINVTGTNCFAYLYNNRFGAGTQANTSGDINVGASQVTEQIGNSSYASGVTPWVDPANGDFRINLPAAINSGRGAFTQTTNSPNPFAGLVGYPDIGAGQHQESVGGGSGPGGFFIQ